MIVTDINALTRLLVKPTKDETNAMIDRWRIYLQSFDFQIKHRPGTRLVIEDALSRSINFYAIDKMDIKSKQGEDALIQEIVRIILNQPESDNSATTEMKNRAAILVKLNKDNFIIEDDVLTYLKTNKKNHHNFKRIVIPEILINDIIQTYMIQKSVVILELKKLIVKLSKIFGFLIFMAK